MESFTIEGSGPLSGKINISGNKNAVLPMIAASLLTDEKVVLKNVPNISDVDVMLQISASLGTEVNKSKDTLSLETSKITNYQISRENCNKLRTSLLFAGPLIVRTGKASMWPPGGDVIGRRRLDGHFYGLQSLGVKIDTSDRPFLFDLPKYLKGRELFFDEASVTATEHIMTTAVLANGTTIIQNAAAEPHVCDLGELLIKMGAKITGLGTNTITIEGVEKLYGTEHTVQGDHIEAGSFLALSAATGGGITLYGVRPRNLWMTKRVFEKFNIFLELNHNSITMQGGQALNIKGEFNNKIPVIADGTWPQYPSDMMSCTIVMATQASGTVMFFEKLFESRIYFVDKLINMGANAIVCDPHRAIISGPTQLRGSEVSSPDIRSGMAIIISALCAKGKSTVYNTEVIYRGYENIVEKISSLGGKIKRN